MKLGKKLLAAPILTALVVLLSAQVNTWLMGREADKGQSSSKASLEEFKTVANIQLQLGQAHASVYRMVAIIGSMDDPKIKAFREDLAKKLAGIKKVAAAINDAAGSDAELRVTVDEAGKLIDKYARQADTAVDLASVDPNTGISSMQGAEATFLTLSKSMAEIVAKGEAVSQAAIAASQQRSRNTNLLLSAVGDRKSVV
jgi:hypothetical protein